MIQQRTGTGHGSTESHGVQVRPRLVVFSLVLAIGMLPVGLLLTAFGVLVLKTSGGAAPDTGVVVGVAAFAVTDFWGGALVATLTRSSLRDTVAAWGIARGVLLLVIVALVAPRLAAVAPVQLVLGVLAAAIGVRVGEQQARLRRAAAREVERLAEREARRSRETA